MESKSVSKYQYFGMNVTFRKKVFRFFMYAKLYQKYTYLTY